MSPHQYFQEMAPIFCTTNVPFSAIGEHMQEHVIENKLSESDRTLLVGGMEAKKILLATPLLKWYLDKGLKVGKIYQAEYFIFIKPNLAEYFIFILFRNSLSSSGRITS